MNIFPLSFIANYFREHKITRKQQFIMWFSGKICFSLEIIKYIAFGCVENGLDQLHNTKVGLLKYTYYIKLLMFVKILAVSCPFEPHAWYLGWDFKLNSIVSIPGPWILTLIKNSEER